MASEEAERLDDAERQGRDRAPTGKTWFDERRHEPGRRQVIGRKFSSDADRQTPEILLYLAGLPQTAEHIAVSLA